MLNVIIIITTTIC